MTGAALSLCLTLTFAAPTPSLAPLEKKIAEISRQQDGVVGVSIVHVESGARVDVRGNQRFVMHSVYKLPISLAVLAEVDAGRLRLDQPVTITVDDFIGLSPSKKWEKLPQQKSIPELIELAISDSDNVASDKLMSLAGGAPAVARWLAASKLPGIDVSRSIREMRRHFCRRPGERPDSIPLAELDARCSALSPPEKIAASRRDVAEGHNTGTPIALANLLTALHTGRLLREPTNQVIRKIMEGTRTGPKRIRAGFPPGTVVAHKTGTGSNGTHDVALVTLPEGRGHLAMAVMVKLSRQGTDAHERTIAAIAAAAAAAPWPSPSR